jgi:hypothetical protein
MLNLKGISFCYLAVILGGCSLNPIYANKPYQANKMYQIQVGDVDGSGIRGVHLKRKLVEVFRLSKDAGLYELRVKLSQDITPLVIQKDNNVTTYNIKLVANYEVVELSSFKVKHSGIAKITTSYDALPSPYASFIAEDNAANNALVQLAEEIKRGIAFEMVR